MTRSRLALLLVFAVAAVAPTASRAQTAAPDSSAARVALPDPVLAPDLPRAIAVLDGARMAASEDRHRDAIRLYRHAIALYPPYEHEIAVELGHQYTWADEPDSAMIWYRKHLDDHPDDVDARLGVARLESWRDNHDAARSLYEGVLEDEPDNMEARLGLARVVNWSGRHREAAGLYQAILEDEPGSTEAREGLARACQWMGRPDRAREVAAAAGEGEPSGVVSDLDRARAPGASYTYEQNKDSDDIERRKHTVSAAFSTDDVTRIGGQYTHGSFTQPGRPDVSRNAIAAVMDRRFSELLAAHAAVGYEWNSFDRAALGPESYWRDDFNLLTIDGYVTVTPRDWTRLDFGLYRGSLENPDAIFRGISLTELSAGLDERLRANLVWVSSLETAWYSDANFRIGLGTRAVWQPIWRIPVPLEHRFTSTTGLEYFGFTETRDNGYYDPRQYWSLYEQIAVDMRFTPVLRGRLAGRLALEKENGDDWFTAGSFEASATWAVWRGLGLTAGFYASDSRVTSREGYQADGFYITLDYLHWTD